MVKEEGAAQIHVALALVKVLKMLPDDFVRTFLPQTLLGVAGLLKSRLQSVRWASRCRGLLDPS